MNLIKYYLILAIFSLFLPLLIVAQGSRSAVPLITIAPIRYYSQDESLYIEGRAEPNSEVELFFEKSAGDSSPVKLVVNANSQGNWEYSQRLSLSKGEWLVRARTIGVDFTSDWSNPRIIEAVETGFTFLGIYVRYAPLVLVLSLILFVGIGLIIYSYLRIQSAGRLAREHQAHESIRAAQKIARDKEKETIELVVEKGFADVKRDIENELEHLNNKLKEKGELSSEEYEHRDKLMREMSKLEEEIDKKIRDLDGA